MIMTKKMITIIWINILITLVDVGHVNNHWTVFLAFF